MLDLTTTHISSDHFVCDADFDPTGTQDIRNKFRRDLDKRWMMLCRLTSEAIKESDIIGIASGPSVSSIAHRARSMPTHAPIVSRDKIGGFQQWFDEALRQIVLNGNWTDAYVKQTQARAVQRAERMLGGFPIARNADSQSVIITSTRSELQGIADAISQQATRCLSQAMTARWRPTKIAREMSVQIMRIGKSRGQMFVGYTVSRAFSEATLDVLEAANVEKVGIIPEHVRAGVIGDAASPKRSNIYNKRKRKRPFDTVAIENAGDSKVCQICKDAAARGPYPIAKARGMIPLHVSCRCSLVPA